MCNQAFHDHKYHCCFQSFKNDFRKRMKNVFSHSLRLIWILSHIFRFFNVFVNWQNFINDILRNKLIVFCIAYLNDIFIFNNICEKHIEHVNWILIRLRWIDFQIDIKKCQFDVFEIKHLNLLIDKNDIKINFQKIQIIQKWKVFITIKKY